jgi:hypothetical protein
MVNQLRRQFERMEILVALKEVFCCQTGTQLKMPTFSPSLTVFAAFNNRHILKPYFFEEDDHPVSVNGERYRKMISDHLIPQMKLKRSFSSAILQQDGAPPHTANETKDLLVSKFGMNRVISKGFPLSWPPYSPDLSPCDFWLWNDLKTHVYALPRPTTLQELKVKIENAFVDITLEMLASACNDVIKRMSLCVEISGGHLEHVVFKQ